MHLEAVSTQVLQGVAESLGLWRDAQVTSGPRTAAQPVERGGQRARVGPGISLDDALDTASYGAISNHRGAGAERGTATCSVEASRVVAPELWSHVEQRSKCEGSSLELGMWNLEPGGTMRTTRIPEEVQVDASWTPTLIRASLSPESALCAKKHVEQLDWCTCRLEPKGRVEIVVLRWPEGWCFVERRHGHDDDVAACVE